MCRHVPKVPYGSYDPDSLLMLETISWYGRLKNTIPFSSSSGCSAKPIKYSRTFARG